MNRVIAIMTALLLLFSSCAVAEEPARGVDEFRHGFRAGGEGERIAVAHEESVKSGEGGVVTLTYNPIQLSLFLLGFQIYPVHGKAVHRIEVIAGYNRTCV